MGKKPKSLSQLGIPRWKLALSYLRDQQLEALDSEVSDVVLLLLCRGRLQLCTENAIYSFDDLYDNYGYAFEKTPLSFPDRAEVLILGFGLGSVALLLEKHYPDQTFYFTGIDLDESVIELASRYTLPRLRSSVTLQLSDAWYFVMSNSPAQYHFIALDVFVDDQIPEQLQTDDYFEACLSLLRPGGIIMMNWLGQFPEDEALAKKYFQNIVLRHCPQAKMIKTSGNVMIIAQA